jgi:hypothetical protein
LSAENGTFDFSCVFANMPRVVRHTIVCALLAAVGCSDPEPPPTRPACLAAVDVQNCAPLQPPEFPELFSAVFSQTCASSGTSCHGANGRQGGLVFADEDQAFALLLGNAGGKARVVPGDAACSELIVRLDSPGQPWSMPPGAPLDEGTRCAIRRWVAAGALRRP